MKITKRRKHSPCEYLLYADETKENFKLVKHFLSSRRVGVTQLDTSNGIQVFGNDEQLTLLPSDYVKVPLEVVRKIENFKYTAISLWTMGEFEKVRFKMRELKSYLKVYYFVYSNQQN